MPDSLQPPRQLSSGFLVAVASLAGLAVFLYPFVLPVVHQGSSDSARTAEAPIVLCAVLILCVGAIMAELDPRAVAAGSSRTVALLATLVALGAVSRLIPSLLGASPIFFLVILAGYVFGPAFGFQVGALTLILSAFLTGGIGPWLPYQMIGVGWVGMGAGFLPGRLTQRNARFWLALYGIVTGFLYGALLNLWFWPFAAPGGEVTGALSWSPALSLAETLAHYARFYIATSLWFDLFRAIGNAALLVTLGPAVIATLLRYRRRLTWVEIDASPSVGEVGLGSSRSGS